MDGPPELSRRLKSNQLAMIGIGGAIGTGLFLGSTLAISNAGPATIVAYILCGLVAMVIAWALAEMVVVHPEAGAFGAIAHRYLGGWAGFVVRDLRAARQRPGLATARPALDCVQRLLAR